MILADLIIHGNEEIISRTVDYYIPGTLTGMMSASASRERIEEPLYDSRTCLSPRTPGVVACRNDAECLHGWRFGDGNHAADSDRGDDG